MRSLFFPLLFSSALAEEPFDIFLIPYFSSYVAPLEFPLPPLLHTLPPSENCEVDVLFLYDTTCSMNLILDRVQMKGENLAQKIKDRNSDSCFALSRFADFPTTTDPFDSPYDLVTNFSTNLPYGFLRIQSGGSIPEAHGYALRRASNEDWREDAHRFVFLFTDAPAGNISQLEESVERSNFVLFTFTTEEYFSFWMKYSVSVFPIIPQERFDDFVLKHLEEACNGRTSYGNLLSFR